MKTILPLLLAAMVAACSKPDKSVEYRATGINASIQFVDGNETWQRASLTGHLRIDTVMTDSVTMHIDSTWIPAHWSYAFEAPHDGTARMVLTQEWGTPSGAEATLLIDGVPARSASVASYRDQVTLTP